MEANVEDHPAIVGWTLSNITPKGLVDTTLNSGGKCNFECRFICKVEGDSVYLETVQGGYSACSIADTTELRHLYAAADEALKKLIEKLKRFGAW